MGPDVRLAYRRVVEGDFQFLLELLDVCSAVCVAKQSGEMLDGVGVEAGSVVGGVRGVLWYPVRGMMGYRFWGVDAGGVCGGGPSLASGGLVGVWCAAALPGCRPFHSRIGVCGTPAS